MNLDLLGVRYRTYFPKHDFSPNRTPFFGKARFFSARPSSASPLKQRSGFCESEPAEKSNYRTAGSLARHAERCRPFELRRCEQLKETFFSSTSSLIFGAANTCAGARLRAETGETMDEIVKKERIPRSN